VVNIEEKMVETCISGFREENGLNEKQFEYQQKVD